MDNNEELDRLLKNKLKDTIKPSKNLEDNIKQKIEEQKKQNLKNENINNSVNKNKIRLFKKASLILSVAAVLVLMFATVLELQRDNSTIFKQREALPRTIKAIEATKVEKGILASDSEFIITVEDENTTVEDVQKSLYVDPGLEYEIEKTGKTEFKLKFKQNIPDNTILKLQYVRNQITEDSWAYQTANRLSVTKTYPYRSDTRSI